MSQDSENKDEMLLEGLLQHPVPEFLQRGRQNPINGTNCFFSEATFRKVVGPEPSFHDKFMIQLARAKEARNIKVDEKKKRHKDLDLPSQKMPDPKILKCSVAGVLSEKSEKSNKAVSHEDSSEDDESSPDLIIAEEEEHVDDETCLDSWPPGKLKEILMVGNSEKTEIDRIVDIRDPQQAWSLPKLRSKHDEEILPLYATGIIPRRNSSLVVEGGENSNPLVMTSSVYSKDVTREIESIARPDSVPDESLSLVMPPDENKSDDDDMDAGDDKSAPSDQSGSSLPLIPALMSEPNRTQKSHSTCTTDLLKPSTTSLFYSSDQCRASSTSETLPRSQNPSMRPAEKLASTTEKEVFEVDTEVPIFSLAGSTEDASTGAGIKKSLRNKGIWSTGQEGHESLPKEAPQIKDNSAKNAINFQRSSLTRNQMATYLELFEKYARPYLQGGQHPTFTEKQKREKADFEALQGRVENEQREFQSYLQQNAIRNPQFYTFIKGHAKHYAYTKAQSYRPPKTLVTKFSHKFSSEIPLQAGSERVELTFQQHLLEMGSPPRVALPDITAESKPAHIPHNMSKIELNFPSSCKKRNLDFLHHESVNEDINAEGLAIKYGFHAVMSSSVVKCLLDNRAPQFKHTWNIPVTVKEHQTEGGVQKVVYLNKPIYEDNLLLRDCNALFHKYALRAMVSQPKHVPVYRSARQQNRSNKVGQNKVDEKTADDPFDMFATDLEALETFGKASFGRKDDLNVSVKSIDGINSETNCRRSKRIAEAHTEKDNVVQAESMGANESPQKEHNTLIGPNADSDQQHGRLGKHALDSPALNKDSTADREEVTLSLIKKARGDAALPDQSTVGKEQSSSLNIEESPSTFTRPKRRVSVLKPSISSTSSGSQPEHPQLSFPTSAQSDSGNLLDLILGPDVAAGGKKPNVPHAKENPSLYTPHSEALSSLVYSQWELGQNKILIRTRSQGNLGTKNVYLTAKLEYQSSHGLEQVTSEEMVRNWAACYIRPNCKLIRARINAFTSEILMFEELECHQILKPSSSFRPKEGFSFMNTVLTRLSSLDQGNYLLSHEPGMRFCGIRTLKHGARLDNIEKPLPIPPERQMSKESVPWIPIDPNLLLPYHTQHQRIPATFLPRDLIIVPGTKKKPPRAKVVSNFTNKKKKKKKKFPKNKEEEFF
ncbi:hypothetical protein RRG08_032156 [Elysia crispata]|uniref:Little elongation complex subunit 2 C-terminal domain-containing protein n=1 Tax=Elysia crispata TaxID=231223 RepID=A0AAE1ACE5_9GAST|nr:hypothetical protein RRG08_032156 [Elysia crispata]